MVFEEMVFEGHETQGPKLTGSYGSTLIPAWEGGGGVDASSPKS